MFRLAHASSEQGKVCAVIYGYFDESATHDHSRLFALCGFLGDPRIWDEFDIEWKKILNKPDWPRRPTELHMVDCVHGVNEFEGWTLAQRLALFGDLSGLIAESNVIAIGGLCLVDAFNSCTAEEKEILERGGFKSPLDFIFQLVLQISCSRTREYGSIHQPPIEEEISFIFDEEPPHIALRFHELYNHHLANAPYRHMLRGIAFEKSRNLSPLQAADLLAYTTYHVQLRENFPGQSDFDFPVTPGFRRLITSIAASGGIIHHEAIRTILLTKAIDEANRPYGISSRSPNIALS
jgi:hypothetical protein